MKVDKISAELLRCAPNALRSQMIRYEGGPTDEHRDWFNANKGKTVCINTTSLEGVLEKLNTSDSGVYNGGRYPYLVRITKDARVQHNALGMLFEYEPSQLRIKDEHNEAV